jgi:type II secretory pathway component GspD/PulD (secretin)
LREIPWLGKLFSREKKSKKSSRLYLFVRPKVLTMPDFSDLRKESNDKKEDLDRLTRKSRIKAEIDERVGGKEDLELRPVPITEQK